MHAVRGWQHQWVKNDSTNNRVTLSSLWEAQATHEAKQNGCCSVKCCSIGLLEFFFRAFLETKQFATDTRLCDITHVC